MATHLPSLAPGVPDHGRRSHLLAIAAGHQAARVVAPAHVLHGAIPKAILVLLHVVALRAPESHGSGHVTCRLLDVYDLFIHLSIVCSCLSFKNLLKSLEEKQTLKLLNIIYLSYLES